MLKLQFKGGVLRIPWKVQIVPTGLSLPVIKGNGGKFKLKAQLTSPTKMDCSQSAEISGRTLIWQLQACGRTDLPTYWREQRTCVSALKASNDSVTSLVCYFSNKMALLLIKLTRKYLLRPGTFLYIPCHAHPCQYNHV